MGIETAELKRLRAKCRNTKRIQNGAEFKIDRRRFRMLSFGNCGHSGREWTRFADRFGAAIRFIVNLAARLVIVASVTVKMPAIAAQIGAQQKAENDERSKGA